VLHPGPSDQFAQADDNAVVLRRDFYGHSVLLLPALGRDGQDALMHRHPDLRAEIVIAGLPARDEPLCEPLLDQLRPQLIVMADAKFPAHAR
jgi:beta-lactamase superfamily II metal-dependent hydrolase